MHRRHRRRCGGRPTPARSFEVCLGPWQVTGIERHDGGQDMEEATTRLLVAKPFEQVRDRAVDDRVMTLEEQPQATVVQQGEERRPVAGGDGVVERLGVVTAGVQEVRDAQVLRSTALTAEVGETGDEVATQQRVVAEAAVLTAGDRHERVRVGEVVEQPTRIVTTAEQLGHLAGQALGKARVEQEGVSLAGQLVEDLLDEEPQAAVAPEAVEDAVDIATGPQRHRREGDARHPSLGEGPEAVDVLSGEVDPVSREQLRSLVLVEAQLGVADLDETLLQAQPPE